MRQKPSIKQLSYLIALAEEEHFGRAAARCFVTQSTMSAGIKELEETLEIKLFERSKRKVMLTPIGRTVTATATEIMLQINEMLAIAKSGREPLTAKLYLGTIPTIGPYVLPRIMRMVRKSYPKLKLYLKEEQTDVLLDELGKGTLDVALIALPYDTQGLSHQFICHDSFQLALPKGHALLAKKSVKISDIEPEELLLLGEGHCLKTHALSACQLAESELRQSFQATSLGTLVEMVNAGLGITLLPDLAVSAGILKGTTIKTLPLQNVEDSREIALIWRKTSQRAEEFQMLGDVISQAIS